jgi:hypothetical protein
MSPTCIAVAGVGAVVTAPLVAFGCLERKPALQASVADPPSACAC